MRSNKLLNVILVIELMLFILFVSLDIFLPTILIILVGIIFLMIKKEKFTSFGFKKESRPLKFCLTILALSILWTIVDYCLFLPILNHLTGTKQDLTTFENLKGNVGQLIFLLIASWTLAALGEELAYRGIVQNTITKLFANNKFSIIVAVTLSSILFGFAHSEQGIIGVIITFIDAIFFSLLKYKFNNLWASILAHGFMNSIGIIIFFFTGPLYGLW